MQPDQPTAPVSETRPFEAEVARLLHLMVHSVYSNRDIFLRELISNAADACEKLRLIAIDKPDLLGDDPELRITISADPKAGTLTVSDNGIGMGREDLVSHLGTIARSGTRAFLEAAPGSGASLIGQFGIGFYSAFMVADRVEVVSRPPGAAEAWRWSSDGKGAFVVEVAPAEAAPKRGTTVTLQLMADAKEYAEEATIERIVAAYSAHVPVPIAVRLDAGERRLADGSALWRKPKSGIDARTYAEFYSLVSDQFDEPAVTLHFKAEGRQEYAALVFVPSVKPLDLFDPGRRGRIKLYVRRVFITDEAEILPAWLRFVRGVVDSEDLPLNLSREMLQANPVLAQIGRGITSRLLSELERLAKDDEPTFLKVWEAFGAVLKEGIYEDSERREALLNLARFRSTAGDGWRTLADYLKAMRPNQTAIYYALGDSRDALAASPQLEGFARRGVEVLLLSDAVDAFWVRTAGGHEGKPFRSVTQDEADLSLIPLVEGTAPEADSAAPAAVAVLAARMKQVLGDRVAQVRASQRLADSPVCLVAAPMGPDRQLERLLGRQQGEMKRQAPVLEINPTHPLIRTLAARAAAGGDGAVVDDAAIVLFGQARILDGEAPDDPHDFAGRIARLLEARLG